MIGDSHFEISHGDENRPLLSYLSLSVNTSLVFSGRRAYLYNDADYFPINVPTAASVRRSRVRKLDDASAIESDG